MLDFRDRNSPSYSLFRALGLVSVGGLLALILVDRLMFQEIVEGGNLIAIALTLIPVMGSALGALLIFKLGYTAIEKQLIERETTRQQYLAELEHSYQSVMIALVAALESRDHQAMGHSRRVVAYAMALAERLGLSQDERRDLLFGGYLHDVGKIGVNDALLSKTSGLSEAEWEEMRRHPSIGIEILRNVEFLGNASNVILHHHERYDGRGYPGGLSGPDIPLLARVFAVADAFDAMTVDRPYRKAVTLDEARRIIREESGRQFCPTCVTSFLSFSDKDLLDIQMAAMEGHQNSLRRGIHPDAAEDSTA